MTIQTTYTQARAQLASLLDEVTNNREIVIIQRRGEEDVALIAADELAGLLETVHLLRSPKNAERLLTALARARERTVAPRISERGNMFTKCHFILYVKDQSVSKEFYTAVFQQQPDLHVPGMTEFNLSPNVTLGIMPESSIRRLLGNRLPDPSAARDIPRAEVYFMVDDPNSYHQRALAAGAKNLSNPRIRDWGHEVAYCLDLDGHVLAFAKQIGL